MCSLFLFIWLQLISIFSAGLNLYQKEPSPYQAGSSRVNKHGNMKSPKSKGLWSPHTCMCLIPVSVLFSQLTNPSVSLYKLRLCVSDCITQVMPCYLCCFIKTWLVCCLDFFYLYGTLCPLIQFTCLDVSRTSLQLFFINSGKFSPLRCWY